MNLFSKRYQAPGTSAGTLVPVPERNAPGMRIQLVDYTADEFTIEPDIQVHDCLTYLGRDSITWVHVHGHPTKEALEEMSDLFGLHSLALEDVLNQGQRPKVEPFEDQLFLVLNLALLTDEEVKLEQFSIFFGASFIVSFGDGSDTAFKRLLQRVKDPSSRLRARGCDYLLYSLLDVVIDHGFPVLEDYGLQLETLEEAILSGDNTDALNDIHRLRREFIMLRRALWPHREVVNELMQSDHAFFSSDTMIYWRDCYDHTIQLMDLLETYREMISSILDIYLTNVSNKMNEGMRLLTVIATIFIPLTFIVGVYGMNFDRQAGPFNMPELGWEYGYLAICGVMLTIAAIMLFLFKRRKWL